MVHRSRQTATMKHLLRPKRDVHGSAACRPNEDYRGVRAAIFRAGMASCARAARRGDLGPRPTHGDGGVTGDEIRARNWSSLLKHSAMRRKS